MSFTTSTRPRGGPALPFAGMVDVLFLLLIFFMTTSVFREQDQQIAVSLPATDAGSATTMATQIVITITEDDQIYIGEKHYTPQQLHRTLKQLAVQFPNESVVIRGDRDSRLDTAVGVMDIAYAAKLTSVSIGTRRPRPNRGLGDR